MANQEQARAGRARLRKAAERLYEDSRLRDALTDEEAQRLLSWAYGRLERTVERTQEMPEEEAAPIVEGQSEAVESVVRRVNAIMDQFSQTAEGESPASLAHFVATMRRVEERAEQAEDAPVAGGEEVNRDIVFQRLMNLITAGEEAE